MWSEYFEMMDFSFQPERNSSSPSRRCSVTLAAALRPGDRLDFELAGALGTPAHAVFGGDAGAARLHRDAVGHDEAAVEADAELADQLRILLLVAFQRCHEFARAALGDGAQVGHRLLGRHADAVVGDGDRLRLGIEVDAHLEVRRVFVEFGLVQRLEAQLVTGVRRVRDQLAEKDLLVRIERMGDEVQDLLDLGLEREGLFFRHGLGVVVLREGRVCQQPGGPGERQMGSAAAESRSGRRADQGAGEAQGATGRPGAAAQPPKTPGNTPCPAPFSRNRPPDRGAAAIAAAFRPMRAVVM